MPTPIETLKAAFKSLFESSPATRETAANGMGDAIGDYVSSGGGVSTPTGTGFRHIAAGVEDSTAKLVVNADVATGAAIAEAKLALDHTTASLYLSLGTKADDSAVVHKAGTETVTGDKTIQGPLRIRGTQGIIEVKRDNCNNMMQLEPPDAVVAADPNAKKWWFGSSYDYGDNAGKISASGFGWAWNQTDARTEWGWNYSGQLYLRGLVGTGTRVMEVGADGWTVAPGAAGKYEETAHKDANSGYVGRDADGAASLVGLSVGSAGSTDFNLVNLLGGAGTGGGAGFLFKRGGSTVGQLVDYSGNFYQDYEGVYALRAGYGGTNAIVATALAKVQFPQHAGLAYVATDPATGELKAATTPSASSVGAPALSLLTTLGDTPVRGASTWERLAGNTTNTKKFLRSTGAAGAATAQAWDTVLWADVDKTTSSLADMATRNYSDLSGAPTLPATKTAASGQPLLSYDATTGAFTQGALGAADVGAMSDPSMTTLGDIPYGGASGAPTKLSAPAVNGWWVMSEVVGLSTPVAPSWVKVVASHTPGAATFVMSDASGKLAAGWGGAASSLATLDASAHVVESPSKYGTVLGDMPYGGASGAASILAAPATNGNYLLTSLVTANAAVAPTWVAASPTGGANTIPQADATGNVVVVSTSGVGVDVSTATGSPATGNANGLRLSTTDPTVNAANQLGVIASFVEDTGSTLRHCAGISFRKESAWTAASGNYPGALGLWTRPAGGNEVEALHIASTGSISIPLLTASSAIATGANKELVSLAAPTITTMAGDASAAVGWVVGITSTPVAGTYCVWCAADLYNSSGATGFTTSAALYVGESIVDTSDTLTLGTGVHAPRWVGMWTGALNGSTAVALEFTGSNAAIKLLGGATRSRLMITRVA